ncbi:hypothetical protein [Streptomyces sp. WAC07149]|uniref:hypothetical protein n=1 Tax=Streptomyces sp. WAC07149 TaxID=2487425 RepID=UPI00163CAF1E|nr:hypothetical protein [Streptomyces sp. WAC07149]
MAGGDRHYGSPAQRIIAGDLLREDVVVDVRVDGDENQRWSSWGWISHWTGCSMSQP